VPLPPRAFGAEGSTVIVHYHASEGGALAVVADIEAAGGRRLHCAQTPLGPMNSLRWCARRSSDAAGSTC
jgi:hypothetical protein